MEREKGVQVCLQNDAWADVSGRIILVGLVN